MHRALVLCVLVPFQLGTALGAAPAHAAPDTATRALIDAGHWKRARAELEPRVKADPSDAEAAALLARVKLTFGDADGALPLAETAVKLEPKTADYHWTLAQILLKQVQQASVFKQMGLSKRFRQESDAAMALDPQHVASRRGSIGYYVNAPGIAGGDTKKADALVEEVGRIDRAAGYLARAQFLNESKAGGDLESLYQQAIATARTPEIKYEAIVGLVNLFVQPGAPKYDAVEPQGRALLAIDPKRVSGYTALAIAFAQLNRLTDLDATLTEAEKAGPDNLGPYFQAGRALRVANKEFPRAERYLRKYLTTTEPEPNAPTLAQAHRNLGLVLEKEGRKADAVAALEQAVKLKPDFD